MKGKSIILAILTLGLLSSCMAASHEEMSPIERVRVDGLIIDENEMPIDHIKVTMDWDSPFSPLVVYSSPKGVFNAELEFIVVTYPVNVSVEISDIDGEENGGLFQTRNVEFTILEENYSGNPNAPIVFQLTRATASESNLLSL